MNITEINLGGRLVPRSLVATDDSAASLVSAIKTMIDNMALFAGISMNTRRNPTSPNAVIPAWRETLFLAFYGMYVKPN
jgi:hypothetical protein